MGTIENSQTLVLVVGLAIMFILVIYSRLVIMSMAFIQEQSCTLFFIIIGVDSILKHDTLTMSHGVCLGDILDSCHYFYAKESKICKHQGLSISQSMVIALTGVNYGDHKNIGYFLHNQWLALTMLTEQPAPEFNLQNIISTTPIS